ncbi:MAG TPA: BREX system Lon protease-like protein BrxL [Blastocatellia bacterium]|nr:BREX system Lon protease-like protein BrxL [Blastocatellia bacterium]HMX26770.1 BREX system Lon protease-like protein BrxL [Blastocatellia bacterium]HMY70261.1 BREX system Lon protease-like protein BrxL [Blastocatellia bacterium]HMZ17555.1 BREX system Lon protease-like protein BrxL [Blastocatellia bacterium]
MNSESNNLETTEALSSEPGALTALDRKILQYFPGLVVRKDLSKGLKQNAVVPTYVLEYLLGQHCATDDPAVLKSGLESVQRILAKHYVHRNQAELVKSTIKEKGRHKIIDKLTVELNDNDDYYQAEFTNLGLKKVPVSDDFVRRFPKLLVGGIWCIIDVTYEHSEDVRSSPWQIDTLKPIQVAKIDFDEFLKARAEFTTEEWMDVLMQSMGFNPEMFGRRAKLLTLIRLAPYCERNYNLLELGPKGTGKSHIYSEFSPHGMLISGSEVTAPKLFVSNASGRLGGIGLVGYWDCICFDEFAGKDKRVDKTLVDIMKNYMANRSFSRGVEQLTAEASMVFMGNTQKSVAYMLKHSHFFEALPDKYIDSAFLDRMHAYNPGWEVAPIRHELFTSGYGFVVDYIAEVLKHLRNEDFTSAYQEHFELASEVSTRDQTGFEKTFSGLMKILYPDGKATPKEIEELLAFAMEARRRVREHILRIDDTFKRHEFNYRSRTGGTLVKVQTPEEIQYPTFAAPRTKAVDGDSENAADDEATERVVGEQSSLFNFTAPTTDVAPQPGHIVIPENTKGWSYRRLFANHLKGARKITVSDPYVRLFFQVRNFMEFLEMVHDLVPEGDEVAVHLITQSDPDSCIKQDEQLNQMVAAFTGSRIAFTWELDHNPNFHARSIVTDTGWKITIDRGLDFFQKFESGPFSIEQAIQETRLTRGAEITYLKM